MGTNRRGGLAEFAICAGAIAAAGVRRRNECGGGHGCRTRRDACRAMVLTTAAVLYLVGGAVPGGFVHLPAGDGTNGGVVIQHHGIGQSAAIDLQLVELTAKAIVVVVGPAAQLECIGGIGVGIVGRRLPLRQRLRHAVDPELVGRDIAIGEYRRHVMPAVRQADGRNAENVAAGAIEAERTPCNQRSCRAKPNGI